MRTIKFRGLDKETGKKVFGYYLKSGDDAQIFDGEFFHSVKPESVAQLVGFDKDGKDVYEGDILLSEYDPNNKAKIVSLTKTVKRLMTLQMKNVCQSRKSRRNSLPKCGALSN